MVQYIMGTDIQKKKKIRGWKERPKATEAEQAYHFRLFCNAEQLMSVPCETGK